MHMQLETAQQSNEADKDNTAVFQKKLAALLKAVCQITSVAIQYNIHYNKQKLLKIIQILIQASW